MEPRIQYAKTSDGVSIAYWTMGEGKPLVWIASPPLSHIQLEWQWPEARGWYERLARNWKLVRYDGRGSGLSDRDVAAYSLDAHQLDLEAVVNKLGHKKFALVGAMDSGPIAIAYAASNPDRVTRLLLWCTYAKASDFHESAEFQAEVALRDQDWKLYTEMLAHVSVGWSESTQAQRAAAIFRECVKPEVLREVFSITQQFDVSALLPQVMSPTLVLHRRQLPFLDVSAPKRLASLLSDASLILLEGNSYLPFLGDSDVVASAIDEFLGAGEVAAKAEPPEVGAFRTILFTDVEGSTALTERLGDAGARDVLREHERMVREALKAHGGSEVKTLGDGFMASFSSATKALDCAITMQRAFAEWNADVGAQRLAPLHVRIGLNAGEPIAEDDPDGRSDLYGTAVNEAARITATAKGGEILVSDVVRQLAKGKDFLFSDRGEANLKGFDEPVRLYEVRWRSFDSSADADGSG